MIGQSEKKKLEEAKRASAGQLLLKCARLLDEVAVARVNRQAGAPVLRPAHTKLFPHIDFQGTRIGTIAERLGVTKQAVSAWIAELAELKVVEVIPDPADGRAKQVRFTRLGLQGIHHGLSVLRQIEDELASARAIASSTGVSARSAAADRRARLRQPHTASSAAATYIP
jgi:DNA-binding MarR family transcriptional regulator